MLPVAKGVKRTYIQTNFYLIILLAASFLFNTISIGLTLMAFTLSLGWLILNIYGYKKMETHKWATLLFIYSLIHMVVLFSTDRKSTRLNSSHVAISYAVCCLKKK